MTQSIRNKLLQHVVQMRYDIIDYALVHSLDELLTFALDEIGALVESPI